MTGGAVRSSDVNPCVITQKLCRSVHSSTHRINVGYRSIDFYSALGCHEHGKFLLPARGTRKASIPRSVVVASTQMSLSSFALQSDTYNYNTTTINKGRSDSEEGSFIKFSPLPDQPSPRKASPRREYLSPTSSLTSRQ